MANLKLDLINRLTNDKYYAELELIRLAQEPNMKYKTKIDEMIDVLKTIATLNAQIDLANQYMKEPTPTTNPVQVHQGQSHGE